MTVTDSDPLTDSQDIAVTATDVAAEAPTITSSASVSVAENQTAVIDVASTDPDSDTEGAGLTYTLSGADSALFSIDAASGVLTFTSAPDFEAAADTGTDNDYEVTVTPVPCSTLRTSPSPSPTSRNRQVCFYRSSTQPPANRRYATRLRAIRSNTIRHSTHQPTPPEGNSRAEGHDRGPGRAGSRICARTCPLVSPSLGSNSPRGI